MFSDTVSAKTFVQALVSQMLSGRKNDWPSSGELFFILLGFGLLVLFWFFK